MMRCKIVNTKSLLIVLLFAFIVTPYGVGTEIVDEKVELYQIKDPPENFPDFIVPGHDDCMDSMEKLLYHHYKGLTGGTMWGLWMPMSQLWPASDRHDNIVSDTRRHIIDRQFDDQGYISCHQHIGLAHPQGWPFPLWPMVKGAGWQFDVHDIIWGPSVGVILTPSLEGWVSQNVESGGLIENKGILLRITDPTAELETPHIQAAGSVSPFFVLSGYFEGFSENTAFFVEWKTLTDWTYDRKRRVYFKPDINTSGRQDIAMKVHHLIDQDDDVAQMRIGIQDGQGGTLILKSFYTSVDSRHQVNNFAYINGVYDYVAWTGDVDLLKSQVNQLRTAMRYAVEHFNMETSKCVHVKWPNHDGRSGIEFVNGKKKLKHGRGVGGSYYDLIPFGDRDVYTTVYGYDVLLKMAQLEEQIRRHPDWDADGGGFDPAVLRTLAAEVKKTSQEIFWNKNTQRFAAIDADDRMHDYGFVFLNLNYIYYDLADKQQSKRIMDWISGKRIVTSDTSKGDDIYHWIFAPRCTTKRNTDYYVSTWFNAESIPWGDQVQDGGAILAWSYYDLMSRIKVYGPDNAWQRLKDICTWFKAVQAEGGYRAYYSKPGRGSLQGGNIAGGLGLDREFIENILVPQVMLYGFMGLQAKLDKLIINPALPSEWPELTITNICWQDNLIDLTAARDKTLKVNIRRGNPQKLREAVESAHYSIEIPF